MSYVNVMNKKYPQKIPKEWWDQEEVGTCGYGREQGDQVEEHVHIWFKFQHLISIVILSLTNANFWLL